MVAGPRTVAETFHLVFLRALMGKGEDKARLALKDGCNLRFYFRSVRYSEDIDFDVASMPVGTLRNKVDRLLSGPLLQTPLRQAGIEIVDVSAPKQTETTQRWKVGLSARRLGSPVRTKVELSRRRAIDGAVFEATPLEVTRPYSLSPVLASHYGLRSAIAQKLNALADRAEPQVRDVFDLAHLFSQKDAATVAITSAEKAWIDPAIERARSMSYDEYRANVVTFLDPDVVGAYDSGEAWETMQDGVARSLEALR